jgi:hypothetical protein
MLILQDFPNSGSIATSTVSHFYWDTEHFPEKGFGKEESFGLVAQEVEKVIPELVTEDKEGYKLVHYEELNLYMLQAIKELKEQNDPYRKQLSDQQTTQDKQQRTISELTGLVCKNHPKAQVCRSNK